MKAALALSDGTVVHGVGFGAEKLALGEAVFNTSMAGYQEALTDPSYSGQVLLMTYPLVGNYGLNDSDFESDRVQAEGFIVREACQKPEHWQSKKTLDSFLREYGTPGMADVDTRLLTRKIRVKGVMPSALLTYSGKYIGDSELLRLAREQPGYSEIDFVLKVCRKKPEEFVPENGRYGRHIVLVDCGVKQNIIRCLVKRGVKVTVVPADFRNVLGLEPDGVVYSNGPGDPERCTYAIGSMKKVLDAQVPLFGICLGNQILAHAAGGRTYKLKFGHRGANQPIKDMETGRIYITSQNHGFAVDAGSLEGSGFFVSKINMNDRTVEGLGSKELPAFSVQYHPEGSPGPKDNEYLFDDFLRMVYAKG